ncbi:hypothetical protein D3C79_871910 [compost metagenome]
MLEVLGREAIEGLLQQLFAEHAPIHERRLHAPLGGITFADGLPVAPVVEFGQASLKQFGPADMEVFAEQIHRPALERVKKRPRQRREDRGPTQQAKQ